jgi:hypothetical protein
MTNDPYRDESRAPDGLPPAGGAGAEPPETAWMPPIDPTRPGSTPATPPGPTPPGPTPATGPPPAPSPQPANQSQPSYPPPYGAPQYQPYQQPAPLPGQPVPPPPGGQPPTNGLAIAALVCSLAGIITLISAPVGAVLGHLATRQIAQTGEGGASLAKAAIWVGWIITGLILALCCAGLAILIAASRADHALGPR